MMPKYHGPFQQGLPNRQFHPPFRGNPMMGNPRNQNGGLLSKLLKKGNTRNVQRSLSPINSLSGVGVQTNTSTLQSVLTNTQKILSTAQQVGPLINQYGPLVKNLPSMWRLYRELKNSPDLSSENNNSNEESDNNVKINTQEKEPHTNTNQLNMEPLPSKPKLYI